MGRFGQIDQIRRWGPLVLLVGLVAATGACASSPEKTPAAAPASSAPSAAAASPSAAPLSGPQAAVNASYQAYMKAVTDHNGQASADLVSQASLKYYDGVRKLALDADAKTLNKQRLVDQFTVLTMRAVLDPAVLRKASPHDIVKTAVEKGLIGNATTPTQALEKIRISGDSATAVLPSGGTVLEFPIRFQREDNRWKFEVTSLLEPTETALDQTAAKQKVTGRKLIDSALEQQFGKAKAAKLYEPLGR